MFSWPLSQCGEQFKSCFFEHLAAGNCWLQSTCQEDTVLTNKIIHLLTCVHRTGLVYPYINTTFHSAGMKHLHEAIALAINLPLLLTLQDTFLGEWEVASSIFVYCEYSNWEELIRWVLKVQFKCRISFYLDHSSNMDRIDAFCLSDHPQDMDLLLSFFWWEQEVITIAFVLQWHFLSLLLLFTPHWEWRLQDHCNTMLWHSRH